MRVAVVGSGIAGLGAAWALARAHDVTIFEADSRAGGHARTAMLDISGQRMAVDTGFIVYNELNYPHLTRLLATLGVRTEASNMSFSVSIDRGRIEYEGSPKGLLAQPINVLRPSYRRMVQDVVRFYREAPRLLQGSHDGTATLGDYLERGGYSTAFAEHHILPMGAAIWSATLEQMRAFPVQSFVQFFVNHRLFDLAGRPTWRTISGGSHEYVERMVRSFGQKLRLNAPVTSVRRYAGGVEVHVAGQPEQRFDQVVLATHADQALAILGTRSSREERQVLGAFSYQPNLAVLHGDTTLMPKRKRVWASWNYLTEPDTSDEAGRAVCVSYWMNRLQNLTVDEPVIVTLNPIRMPDPRSTHQRIPFRHPQFDRASVEAQARMPEIQGHGGVWFCGSYCGHGFHEDGLQAGFSVAAALGAQVPWADRLTPDSPAAQAVLAPVTVLAAE